ncbi:unnamed protein product [Mycena citricolor]|uniref:Uncharacterized protein n=1 Tax=Mycena citricolor TaxID=2018698 RepID=A0AAD2HQB5_9AGAR|nr:unnamed protein product [Mycena citricolor]
MTDNAVPKKHLEIPFSLDEYEDRNVPEFRLEDRLAFWDGSIRAFLHRRGYALYSICPVFDGASSLMYPTLETCPQPVDDERYAFMDPDNRERVLPKAKPGLENTYPYCREKAYARENRGRAAFAQCIARPDRHAAIKLVRDRSVETHTLMQGEYDCDPFAADVSILGAPLFDGMLHWDVPSRLTAPQALSLLRTVGVQYSELDKQPLPAIPNKFIDVMKYNRWNGLPPDFVERATRPPHDMASEALPEKDLDIPFSLDEYEDREIPEFRIKDRIAFWDGPIRVFLRKHGYVLYNMRAFPEYDLDSVIYPALETPDQLPDDDRYAFVDADYPEREISEHGEDDLYASLCSAPYTREFRGRAAFAQSEARPDRHFAIKLVRAESVEIHTIKLIYEASKEKLVRGLIPVIEIIPFRGHWLVVMPRWGEEVFLPFPTVAGPVYDLIEDLLEGLSFLHSHNIVHRDHSSRNIVVNHIPILTYDDVREFPETRQTLRNAGALRHAIFDFDVALVFPDRSSARLPWMEFYLGARKRTHDVRQGEYDFDPFAADMAILGSVLDDSLRASILTLCSTPDERISSLISPTCRSWHRFSTAYVTGMCPRG